MNVLLTSVGRRGYLVRYFKEALGPDGQVWGADNSRYAPGFAYCDHRVIVPEITHADYFDHLLDLCSIHHIDIVIPLIDPELEILSGFQEEFVRRGIMLLLSPRETIEIASDKFLTWQFARQHGIAMPQTFITVAEALGHIASAGVCWPLLVKPRHGSASMNLTYCFDRIQLEGAFEACPLPMIQEVVKGAEYGFDLFADGECRPVSVYCKRKLAMRAGETDKAVSTNTPMLIAFGAELLERLKIIGPADVDVIVDKDGPKLLEINPRFGGGYPCSHLAGAAFPQKILAMRKGTPLTSDIGNCPDGVCMLKQDEIIQPDWNGLKG
jgi:carbamoyl-phosphate synthase large subunit